MKRNNRFDTSLSIINARNYVGNINRKNDEDDDDCDEPAIKRNLSRSGNHIYFYDAIDVQSQMWLQNQMRAAYEEYIVSNAKEYVRSQSISENIYLHINSPGGSVTSALALYDFIKTFPMVCVGIVEGMAASGASILLCACAMRQMSKTSVVLCHELRHIGYGFTFETWRNVQDNYENDKFFMQKIKDIYLSETKIPENAIDEALSHDLFWGVDKCLEYELCDYVCGSQMTEELIKSIDERVDKRLKDNPELSGLEPSVEDSDVEEKPKKSKKKIKTDKKASDD